ncbi:hypothetical protein EYC80_004517 [Monilinia laxa]|uniref:HTH APSES-type domain-containing protein n=1 Tax=Monilinia laxa TaxID=61186 RepID=A0A5N6KGZ8_MONLA|nr:hypothetical protein EYC80_004517 [Monilinia laxa]
MPDHHTHFRKNEQEQESNQEKKKAKGKNPRDNSSKKRWQRFSIPFINFPTLSTSTHHAFLTINSTPHKSLSFQDLIIPTEKLDLPSISQVQTRGPTEVPFYNHHAAQRPLYVNERLPALPLPPPQQAYSSGTSSPRVGSLSSLGSSSILNGSSHSSYTTASSSNGPKTPSPTPASSGLPVSLPQGSYSTPPSNPAYSYSQEPYQNNMNHGPPDMYYPPHMSAGQPPPPQTATSGALSQYPQHQPPLLQPGPAHYSPAQQASYGQYYGNGLQSPQSAQIPGSMGGQGNVLPLPAMTTQPGMPNQGYGGGPQQFDQTGQVAPPGMKPRVTATLWEDEGSLCFQVEAKGVCVARREDNHMINGTKLLNVAGMTRGRRDGILKSEKMRHVVKIGPMHLKGVWIPFERALDFANKEKITELLYPLFVHNIGALLYHPTNQTRTNAVMAAAERRKNEQNQMRNPQAPGPQHQLAPHPNWPNQSMGNVQGTNPLSIDTGLSNARSMPTTPATTPPGTSVQSMQQYQQNQQPYDSRQMYSQAPPPQNAYAQAPPPQQSMPQYSQQPNSYIKNEMGPPLSRAPDAEPQHHESKDSNGMIHHQGNGQVEDEHDQEHDGGEYTHDSQNNYDSSRRPYNYPNGPAVGSITASGRATPRTASAPQSYYAQQQGYSTPPRIQPPSSNLYNVVSQERGTANGSSSGDNIMNGAPANNKRGRDDDDDGRPSSRGPGMADADGLKRRKTIREGSVSGPSYNPGLNRAQSTIAQRRR